MKRFTQILAIILISGCTSGEHAEISPALESGPVFVVGRCSEEVLVSRSLDECIQIYNDRKSANQRSRPIKEIDKKIRSFTYEQKFGVCSEKEVDTLVFIHIVELVKIEQVVRSSAILPFPCI